MGPPQVRPQHDQTGAAAPSDVRRTLDEPARPLFVAALAALSPRPGTRLLHVGCGAGTVLEIAAAYGAELAGVDSDSEPLNVARDRLPEADLRLAAADELPFDRGCFDQVVAFDAIQYAERPAIAVAELARVTRPGGVVAIGLWHNWSGREASAFLNAVRPLVPAAPPGTRPVRDLFRLREVMVEAGLDVYASAEVTHRYDFADLQTAWESMTASRHVARAIEVVGREAAHEVFTANFAHLRRPDGSIQQENLFQYALGRATS